jgi:HEPN domain-containing protein
MKKDTEIWLTYAEENLRSSEVLLNSSLFNPCLQNAQQAVEKFLKAVLVENSVNLFKTHSIRELAVKLANMGIDSFISEDDTDLLDSIYLPSKYPLSSVLPHYMPDEDICRHCLMIAQHVRSDVLQLLAESSINLSVAKCE